MIFGHGPSGFFTTWLLRVLPQQWKPSERRTWLLLALGTVGAMIPDIDLFYVYLVDASHSHREFITHTPILWLGLAISSAGVLQLAKKQQWIPYTSTFFLAAVLHVAFDTITAQIRFLWPLSNEFYGVADLGIGIINRNLLFTNFLVEGIWITLALYAAIVLLTKTRKQRLLSTALLLVVFFTGAATLTYANQHVHHGRLDEFTNDLDGNGIPNYLDRDIDGDGQLNIDDLDADNDDKHNVLEIIERSEEFFGIWKDPTHGGFIHIPIRLGLLNNEDLVPRLFADIGIHIKTEIGTDFAENPDGYVGESTDKNFTRNPENLRTWLQHIGRYQSANDEGFLASDTRIGDILFFESGQVGVMTGVSNTSQLMILDLAHGRQTQERTIEEMVQLAGPITGRGVLLDQTPLFR